MLLHRDQTARSWRRRGIQPPAARLLTANGP
jgi:hypothetical protein